MSNTSEHSTRLNDLLFRALDHGFSSIEDASGPLVRFVMFLTGDGRMELTRYVTERLEEGVAKAREDVAARMGEFQIYARAWDGFVTLEGKRADAIFVEAAERGQDFAVLLCQRYIPGSKDGGALIKAQRFGNAALIGKPKSLF